jgi:hypothetical protein
MFVILSLQIIPFAFLFLTKLSHIFVFPYQSRFCYFCCQNSRCLFFFLLTEVRIRIRFRKNVAFRSTFLIFPLQAKSFQFFHPGRKPATFASPDQIMF